MDVLLLVLEIIGTVAFAVSGAITGIKKGMDVFGVAVLGMTTAVGGGICRDLILGITPPIAFRSPMYAMIALGTALLVFTPQIRKLFKRGGSIYERVFLLMDTVGLAAFTVTGIRIAYGVSEDMNIFLFVFVGVVTGCGGGILRDVFASNPPVVFSRQIYASASMLGAVLCSILWIWVDGTYAMLAGLAIIVMVRYLSVRFKMNLPRSNDDD